MQNSTEILTTIVEGVRSDSFRSNIANVNRLFEIAGDNDLILAVGDALRDSTEIPEPFRQKYQRLRGLRDATHEIMGVILNRMRDREIPIVTIKSFLPFPYVDSNVDIVAVGQNSVAEVRRLLVDIGYARLRNLADVREPGKEMYRPEMYASSQQCLSKIHLHRSISWNGITYLNAETVWQNSQKRRVGDLNVPVPCPEDEILIMAAHAIFENKYITLAELIYLDWLIEHSTDWEYLWSGAREKHWQDALLYFFSTAKALGCAIGMDYNIEVVPGEPQQEAQVTFPYVLPQNITMKLAWRKLLLDIRGGQLKELPRALFTYSIVDHFWMYRKARKKVR